MPQRSRGMLRTSARPIGGCLKLQGSSPVDSRMAPLSVTRRCINLARSPPCRFSGVAIYQSGPTCRTRGPAGFGHIPVPGWVQRKPAFGFGARKKEKRVHWSARVEGLSLVYLANVWREREEGEELLYFSPLTSTSSSSYKAPDTMATMKRRAGTEPEGGWERRRGS